MGQMNARLWRSGGAALIWSLLLVLALYLADRGLWGVSEPDGWQLMESLDVARNRVHAIPSPALLPERFDWPPQQVWFEPKLGGWWLGLGKGKATPQLWIGGQMVMPAVMKTLTGCSHGRCPPSWLIRSKAGPGGKRVVVMIRGTEVELERILLGIGFHREP